MELESRLHEQQARSRATLTQILLALQPQQLVEDCEKRGIYEDQAETRASRLAERLLPHGQKALLRANILRKWLRGLPTGWRAAMRGKLGEDAKMSGQMPDLYNVALMQHIEEGWPFPCTKDERQRLVESHARKLLQAEAKGPKAQLAGVPESQGSSKKAGSPPAIDIHATAVHSSAEIVQSKSGAEEKQQQPQQPSKRVKLVRNHWGGAMDDQRLLRQHQLRHQHQQQQQARALLDDYMSKEQSKAAAQLAGCKFCLDISSCVLPDKSQLFSSQPWTLPEMRGVKASLNDVKSQLDGKDLKSWRRHTNLMNKAGIVVSQLRQSGGVELCTVAWAQMMEMLVTFDLLPASLEHLPQGSSVTGHSEDGKPAIGVVSLGDAPSAFLSATNHFLKTHRPALCFDWMGSGLCPWYEGNTPAAAVTDDALVLATMPHWHWGEDGSGDLRSADNIKSTCSAAGSMTSRLYCQGAALVTADGSVDCHLQANEQEKSTAPLLFCEMVAALGVLAPGGSFVVRAFTLFEHSSVCVLYLLGSLFKEVCVFKPATSKASNSEVYIISKGFKGIPNELHEELVSHAGQKGYAERAMLPLKKLSAAFRKSCADCATLFAGKQQEVIASNLALEHSMLQEQKSAVLASREWLAAEWPRVFHFTSLHQSQFLAPQLCSHGAAKTTADPESVNQEKGATLLDKTAHGKRQHEQTSMHTSEHASVLATQSGVSILRNRSEVLTSADLQSWRVTQQRQPKQMLRSNFLPKQQDFNAVRAARQLMRSQHAQQPSCPHKDPCTAPQGAERPHSFQHMAALDAAYNICSTTASHQQAQHAGKSAGICSTTASCEQAEQAGITVVDLSLEDSGAVQYVLTQSAATVKSAQLLTETAARKLQGDNRHEGCRISSVYAAADETADGADSDASVKHLKDATVSTGSGSKSLQPVNSKNLSEPSIGAKAVQGAVHTLASFDAAAKHTSKADLVIGDLNPENDLTHHMRKPTKGRYDSPDQASVKATLTAQQVNPMPIQGEKRLGVMEDEYSSGFRARLLWECALALSCLQPGGAFVVQLPDTLTTFTASAMYLLQRSFEGISLLKPSTSCACTSSRFLVCLGRLDDGNVGATWLQKVMHDSELSLKNGRIVGDFVPPSLYLAGDLSDYLSLQNAALAQMQVKAIHEVKKQEDSGKVASDAEQASSLRQAEQRLRLEHCQTVQPTATLGALQPPRQHPSALKPGQGNGPVSGSCSACSTTDSESLVIGSVSGQASDAPQSAAAGLHQQQQQQPAQHGSKHVDGAPGAGSATSGKPFPLYVISKNGEELVCEVKAAHWPSHLARPQKLIVGKYQLTQEAMTMPNLNFVGHLHPAQVAGAQALLKFADYLKGFRGPAQPLSLPKVAVAKTSSYTMILKPGTDSKPALEYWVRQVH